MKIEFIFVLFIIYTGLYRWTILYVIIRANIKIMFTKLFWKTTIELNTLLVLWNFKIDIK